MIYGHVWIVKSLITFLASWNICLSLSDEPDIPNSFGDWIIFEKSQFLQRMCELIIVFATSNFAVLIAAICFVIGWKELKPAQTAQINKLSLNNLYLRRGVLWFSSTYANKQNNDVSKDSVISHFHIGRNAPYLPPHILHIHCLRFLLGRL